MPSGRRANSRARLVLRIGKAAQIVAVEREDVKGVELDLVVLFAGVQGIEVGDAVDAEHHRLAVDHEPPDAVLQRRFHDPRIGPVVAAARDQADAVAVALKPQAVSVVLDLVKPFRT